MSDTKDPFIEHLESIETQLRGITAQVRALRTAREAELAEASRQEEEDQTPRRRTFDD